VANLQVGSWVGGLRSGVSPAAGAPFAPAVFWRARRQLDYEDYRSNALEREKSECAPLQTKGCGDQLFFNLDLLATRHNARELARAGDEEVKLDFA
jgi:hypothetical protein